MYIPQTPPIWQTILSFQLNPTDTTATIASELLINGNALGGLLCVSIDIGQPNPEYAIGTLSGNVITFITRNCDPLNPNNTIGTFGSIHGAGAVVKITDFASIQMMVNLFNGVTGLQNIISYASPLTPVNPQDIVDKAYVDAGLLAGAPDASTTTKGLSRLSASPNVTLGNPTITIANPAVITLSAHGLTVNDEVQFTTTGALPSPITAGVTYYVISSGLTTNAFEISLTAGGAAISTLGGTQSGTHTLIKTTPVSVGVNDTRLPNQNQTNALSGESGIPLSSSNKVEDFSDTGTSGANKLLRLDGSGNLPILNAQNLTNLPPEAVQTIPLGEAFTGATTPQPAVIIDDIFQGLANDVYGFGGLTNGAAISGLARTNKLAVSIVPRSNVTAQSITAYFGKTGSPTGNITIEIQTDSSGAPSNTPITNGTSNNLAASGLTIAQSLQTLNFASPFTLTAGTKYWVVFKESDNSDTNFVFVQVLTGDNGSTEGGNYGAFVGMKTLTTTWSASDGPAIVQFKIIPSSGSGSKSLWRATGGLGYAGCEMMNLFSGFVTTTASAGSTGTIVKGNVNGFSLIGYMDYYVSSSIGTITTDPTQGGMYVGTTNAAGTTMITKFDKQQGITTVQRIVGGFNGIQVITTTPMQRFSLTDGTVFGDFQSGNSMVITEGGITTTITGTATGGTNIPFSIPIRKGTVYTSAAVPFYNWRPNI